MVETEVDRFFCRTTHLSPGNYGKLKEDMLSVVRTYSFLARATAWGETSQVKLCIYGVLPFTHNSVRFGVPIQIWLTSQYPIDPPTIFVVPSDHDEKIMSNAQAVDGTGVCYCPELAAWSPAESMLMPVIAQLVRLFADAPPLWLNDIPASPPTPSTATTFAEAPAAAASGAAPPEKSGGESEDDVVCVVCLTEKRNTALVPCGHVCVCFDCAANLRACPLCRTPIQYRQKLFL